jgi:hypothetical protein
MTDHLHSSALPRGVPLPKTVLGRTRQQEKDERDRAEDVNWRRVCALVDKRDAGRCRVCGRRCVPTAIDPKDRAERHHLIFVSQGGPDETWNVLTICKRECHPAIHTLGLLKLSGDADATNDRGVFNGVKVERLKNDVWKVTRWV